MKFTEEEIIEIQKLTKKIAEEAQLGDTKYIKYDVSYLKTIIDCAIFNDWYNRMYGEQ